MGRSSRRIGASQEVQFGKNDPPDRFFNPHSESILVHIKKIPSHKCDTVFLVDEDGFGPSKLTQQIYSLPPLATRELVHMNLKKWSWWTDLNPRPADYKSAALPTELHQLICGRGDRTRTCGILVPNQALYQTELRPAAIDSLLISA